MSDFDDVLERLVNDPTFAARLAADPDTALNGYALAPHERELLGGPGADRTVEVRTSKSGMVGMLGPVVSALGVAVGSSGLHESFGTAVTGNQTLGDAPGTGSLGPAPQGGAGVHQSLGSAGANAAGGPTQSLGSSAPADASLGSSADPAVGYHTRVDADGDGRWDAYRAYNRPDGGVDVEVDMDGDGRVDFVGHDVDRDGIMDSADFDNDHDGRFETRMTDDNGDGWMDRSERAAPPGSGAARQQTFGSAPSTS
jgi:hypothetical protein